MRAPLKHTLVLLSFLAGCGGQLGPADAGPTRTDANHTVADGGGAADAPSSPTPDAAPGHDAGTSPGSDSGSDAIDGGTPPEPDAGTPSDPDAGTPPEPDAGTPSTPDAGAPSTPDAGTPSTPDAGTPTTPDAGTPGTPDAGAPGAPDAGTPSTPDAGPAPSPSPSPVFGLTITDPWGAGSAILGALDGLGAAGSLEPTVRVVFDEGIDRLHGSSAGEYVDPLTRIGPHARVMGELLDSFYVPGYSVSDYRSRACEYRATLGHLVDVWEIGNEVNGEWLLASGEAETVVIDKIVAAAEVFTADAARFRTLCPGYAVRSDERPYELAMTAYANGGATGASCWERRSHHMETWLQTHFGEGGRGASVRDALDYVFVSYYEDDCEGIQPDWAPVFDRIGTTFPRALLGFGECGTIHLADRARMVARYYSGMDSADPAFENMHVSHPRYVGGNFWWYFDRDATVPAVYGAFLDALDGTFWSR